MAEERPTGQSADPLVEQFQADGHMYQKLLDLVQGELDQLLISEPIHVHSISGRVKSPDSLAGKLIRNSDRYQTLEDVTDLVALRVITYFTEDVDRVARSLVSSLVIDEDNSVDKRVMDPDRFGYQSLHFVASLPPSSVRHDSSIATRKFEIQIRTILQHAWAEIEHDLGYKSAVEIPRTIRRQFSMLAGVLEMADAGFSDIRSFLTRHAEAAEDSVRKGDKEVEVDRESVSALVTTSALIGTIDKRIAEGLGVQVQPTSQAYMGTLARSLKAAGYEHIHEVEDSLSSRASMIEDLALEWITNHSRDVPAGVSLFYMAYVSVGISRDSVKIRDFFAEIRLGMRPKNGQDPDQLAQHLLGALDSVRK